jgi:DMSO/TMAO reductase YedYZ molybdopterin-dependent catalytic subunit
MRKQVLLRACLLGLLLLGFVAGLCACGPSTPKVQWQFKVTGGSKELALDYAALAKMKPVELKDVLMQKSRGEDETHSYSGASLDELLVQAGAPEGWGAIKVTASDGYSINITREEAQGGIVALKQDGKWIADTDKEHGPLKLVFPQTPANRWVFQVTEIEIRPAP